MTEKKLRVIHYINQFFGQIGGEEKADTGFLLREERVGPSEGLQKALGDKAEVIATLICGDNYFSKRPEQAAEEGFGLIEQYAPDMLFAGPAFAAGRYGIACGAMCKIAGERLGVPAVTALFEENPAVELYRKYAFICRSGNSIRDMVNSLNKMTRLGLSLVFEGQGGQLLTGENLPRPEEYDYFPRNILRNEYTEKTAAQRSIDELLAKLRGEAFTSEVVLPDFEKVDPPDPLEDLGSSVIALVSDGGLVPKGNPDKLSGRGNLRWTTYELDSFLPEAYSSPDYEIAHTGYFPVEVLENPNRLVPADVLRELVKKGVIGTLHPTFYSTSGNATVSRRCEEMGNEIAADLKEKEIHAAILTST